MPLFSIVMVCVGNVCRSPVAERLLQREMDASLGCGQVDVRSAGTRGLTGSPVEARASEQLLRLGGDPSGFSARRLEPETLSDADLVLAMTRDVRAEALRLQPRAMRRTFTLLEFSQLCRFAIEVNAPVDSATAMIAFAARHRSEAAFVSQDVPDPIGRSADVHREVADLISANIGVVSALMIPLLRRGAATDLDR